MRLKQLFHTIKRKRYFIKIFLNEYVMGSIFNNYSQSLSPGSIVYIADSNIWPGGLVDRLKGIISLYDYSRKHKLDFYIYLSNNRDFTNYLTLNNNNMYLNQLDRNMFKNKLCYHLDDTELRDLDNVIDRSRINHIYLNHDLLKYQYSNNDGKWHELYRKLFTPSESIIKNVEKVVSKYQEYIAFHFRFGPLLGDFDDNGFIWDESKQKDEMEIINKSVLKHIANCPTYNIYIASDSSKFVKQLYEKNQNIFFYNKLSNASMDNYEQSVIELLILSRAKEIVQFQRPNMKALSFSKYASLIGNNKYQLIKI